MPADGRFIKRVTLDITNQCNLKCIMCPQSREKREKHELPFDVYRKLASEVFPFTEEIFFSCAYESTMSAAFADILDYLPQFGIPKSALVTNATLLDRNKTTAIIRSGLKYLMISVDGARKKTYEAIRKGATFENLLDNIRLLNALKEEHKVCHPEIDLTFTLMKSNIGEMPLLAELAASLNVAIINFKPLQVHMREMEKEALDCSDAGAIRNNLIATRSFAEKHGISVHLSPEMSVFDAENSGCHDASPRKTCSRKCVEPFPSFYIRPGGEVLPCTLWKEKPVGNVRHQSFDAIWNDADYRSLRSELNSGNFRESCQRCCYLVS